MASYENVVVGILQVEQGYVDHKSDRGGETYAGISRKNWPHWDGWFIIDEAKTRGGFPKTLLLNVELKDKVNEFYFENFFLPIAGQQIKDDNIVHELMDTAVNQGLKKAIIDAQRSINLLNQKGKFGSDVDVDGIMGHKTVSAINSFPYPWAISTCLNGFQFERYVKIAENDPTQEDFFRGWLIRVKL